MKLLRISLFIVLFWGQSCPTIQTKPNIYWSMNNGNGSIIYPDIGNRKLYFLNVKPQEKGVNQGVNGDDALNLNHSRVETSGMTNDSLRLHENCFKTPSKCQGGLSLGMWIRTESTSSRFCFFSSSIACFGSYPGVVFRQLNHKFTAAVTINESLFYKRSVNLSNFEPNNWNHFSIIWKNDSGLKLFVNGTEPYNYVDEPLENVTTSINRTQKIIFGSADSPGIVLIDEVKLWFVPISISDLKLSTNISEFFFNYKIAISTTSTKKFHATKSTQKTRSDQWRWSILGVCILTLSIMALMVLLLFIRKKKARRNLNTNPTHSGSSWRTPTSNLSSRLESSTEY